MQVLGIWFIWMVDILHHPHFHIYHTPNCIVLHYFYLYFCLFYNNRIKYNYEGMKVQVVLLTEEFLPQRKLVGGYCACTFFKQLLLYDI